MGNTKPNRTTSKIGRMHQIFAIAIITLYVSLRQAYQTDRRTSPLRKSVDNDGQLPGF